MTNFVNKLLPMFVMDKPDGNMRETTLIGINQARAVMDGGPHGPKTRAAAGAFSWKHGQLASIQLRKGAPIREDANGPIVGREVNWTLMKGKAGTHDGKRGSYNYFHVTKDDPVLWKDYETTWMGGVDVMNDAVATAKELGVIQMAGSWASWGDIRVQGLDKLSQKIAEDPKLQEELKKSCYQAAGLSIKYR